MNIKFPEPQFENIEIKCKRNNKEEKESTVFLINEISLAYDYAAKFLQGQGCEAIALDYEKKAQILFELLKQQGVYDKYL